MNRITGIVIVVVTLLSGLPCIGADTPSPLLPLSPRTPAADSFLMVAFSPESIEGDIPCVY